MKKLEIIDYAKGYSILTIVLMHLIQNYNVPEIIKTASSFGGAGVHVFIFCSGFGLYFSHLINSLPYKSFLRKRFIKIYIPYILVILLSACIPFYSTSENKLLEILSHVFLFKMFIESLEGSLGYQMWFISTIIQFYLFWPIIVHYFAKGNKWNDILLSLSISLLWSIMITLLGINSQRIWNSFFLQYLWEFVLGMKLASIYYNDPIKVQIPQLKSLFFAAGIGIIITGMAGIKGGWFKTFNDIPSFLGYSSILLITYKVFPKIWKRFILFTNKISYEWYLLHILVFTCCLKTISLESKLVSAGISLIISYLLAYLYSKFLRILHIR